METFCDTILQEENEKQERNRPLVNRRMKRYNKIDGPRVGDYVVDKKRDMYRIAYVWRDEKGNPLRWQVDSGSGSYYLGDYGISFSGGLDSGFGEGTKFKNLGYKRNGSVWVFDENFAGAGRGVDFNDVKFRVYKANRVAKV